MSGQVEDIPAPVSANIVAEIERLGMTNTQLARALSVSERQVTRWRGGQTPEWENVVRIARFFGRPPEWFYTDHDKPVAA